MEELETCHVFTHDEIKYKAYMVYLDRIEDGCKDADDAVANWYEAEKQLEKERKRT
jgi:hypothetical protein